MGTDANSAYLGSADVLRIRNLLTQYGQAVLCKIRLQIPCL